MTNVYVVIDSQSLIVGVFSTYDSAVRAMGAHRVPCRVSVEPIITK